MPQSRLACTAQFIARHAIRTPRSTAVVEDAAYVDYRTMASDLARCVRTLEQDGMRPGMLVGVEIRPQRYLQLLLLLACEALGAATVSLAARDLADDDPMLRRCDLLLLGDTPVADHQATRTIPPDWPQRLAAIQPRPPAPAMLHRSLAPEGIARIIRTSGTTGRPKTMATSHAIQQRIVDGHMQRVAADIFPNAVSLCLYNFGARAVYVRILGLLQRAGTVVFAREEHATALLAAGAVNHAMFTVGDMERIIRHAAAPPAEHRLHVELVGASASPALRQAIRERLGAQVSTRYSTNETSMIADTDDKGGGRLCPGVCVRIVDDAGRDVPPGEVGLIRVQTPTMVDGYLDDPALTAASFIDGWYHTNDIGCTPVPGRLTLFGRADDMLNIGGVKVPPRPLEDAIKRIPGVSDAVLVAVGRTGRSDLLLAAVEVAQDRPPADLGERVGGILSRYVTHFEIMPLRWFPRTETGKPRRTEITAAFRRR